MAKRRGLGGTAYTKQDLKAQVKACGSHYFSPGSMRFFNSRLLAVYPSEKRKSTYFVMAQGGSRHDPAFSTIPRHYVIGVFKNCNTSTIGKGSLNYKTYKTAAAAKKVARAIASKADGYGTTLKTRKRKRRK